MQPKPRVLASSCLLGAAVRFDGGHRRSSFVTMLGSHVDFVPVCPEVEAGLGVPRPSLRLVDDGRRLRMLSARGTDETERIHDAGRRILLRAGTDLDGAVLKKGSPSCGPERVKVYGANGMPLHPGQGLFAGQLRDRWPRLAVEDEGRLEDAGLRDSFLVRIFAHARVRGLFAGRWTPGQLVAFHARHKLLLMAHSPKLYQDLGRLVARAGELAADALRDTYVDGLMHALSIPARRGRHLNVLQHMAGYVSAGLDSESRRELHGVLAEFGDGLLPVSAARTLLQHHMRRQQVRYLQQQVYLQPYPPALAAVA